MLQKQTTTAGQHEGEGMMWVEKLQRLGNDGVGALLRIQHCEKLRKAFDQRKKCSDLHFESQSARGTEGAVVVAGRPVEGSCNHVGEQ